jgi:hypothetical protein
MFFTDTLQVLSVVIAYFSFERLQTNEKNSFFTVVKIFIWVQCLFMVLQNFFPYFQTITAELFAGRPSSLVTLALTRNNAVTGFSPEPSYGSSLLVSLYFLLLLNDKFNPLLLIPTIVSLLLFKSVYGFGLFYIFGLVHIIRENKYIFLTIIFNFFFASVVLFNFASNSSLERIILFIKELVNSKSLLQAEKFVSQDSTRLDFLVIFNNWFEFDTYYKSISIGVYFLQATHFFLVFFILFLVLLSRKFFFISNILTGILFFLITPILVWPSFLVLVQFLEFRKVKINENNFS